MINTQISIQYNNLSVILTCRRILNNSPLLFFNASNYVDWYVQMCHSSLKKNILYKKIGPKSNKNTKVPHIMQNICAILQVQPILIAHG